MSFKDLLYPLPTYSSFLQQDTPSFSSNPPPPSYFCPPVSPLSPFYSLLTSPPSENRDLLYPTRERPSVQYTDEGMWRTKIDFHKEVSPSVNAMRNRAAEHAANRSFENLDALCEAELARRFPNYQVIYGIKRWFKDHFATLTRWVIGDEKFYQALTPREIETYKKQIAFSACNRDDLVVTPSVDSPVLKRSLGMTEDAPLASYHLFAKNSPMNGLSFHQGKETILLSQAIACSSDKKVENTSNLRVVKDAQGCSVAYTGRVDSDRKVEEQAAFLFFTELQGAHQGITQVILPDGSITYEMDYLITSLLSTPWIWAKESPLASAPERLYVEKQIQALHRLREKGPHLVTDPHDPSKTYRVQFNPVLVADPFNSFVRLHQVLPPFLTGEGRAAEITEEGMKGLEKIAVKKMQQLQRENHYPLIQQIQENLKRLNALEHDRKLEPEEKILTKILHRDYLCKLLGLPIVYHCKSSTDRTGITLALSQALGQWIALKQPLPTDLSLLLKDWRFKELFSLNWMTGHQITRYARGGEGTVCGTHLNPKNLGYCLHTGIEQNPLIRHLVPERYLTPYSFCNQGIRSLLINCTLIFTVLSISVLLIPIAMLRLFSAPIFAHRITRWELLFPLIPLFTLTHLPSLFPDKVLNEASPQVGERKLIAKGKHGKGTKDL